MAKGVQKKAPAPKKKRVTAKPKGETPVVPEAKPDKTDNPKEAMIRALENSLGVVSDACKKVGISRDTHYEWLKADPEYKRRVDDIKEISLDFVEGKMFSAIKDGDTSMIKYFLSTQGKKRGYVEKQQIEHEAGNSFLDFLKATSATPSEPTK